MNCKEEREERAVEGRERREEEQLRRVREMRWRKGLEESQTMRAEEEQGSFEVGMFRDWRALSCSGSRVEDEGWDGGDSDGEMAGERVEGEEVGVEEKGTESSRSRRR